MLSILAGPLLRRFSWPLTGRAVRSRGDSGWLRRLLAVWLLGMALFGVSGAAAAACPASINVSVQRGGTVQIPLDGCSDVYLSVPAPPDSGVLIDHGFLMVGGSLGTPPYDLKYQHDGSTSLSTDTFTMTALGSPLVTTVTITVTEPPPLVVSPFTLPVPIYGSPYSQTLGAAGGTAPYTYAVTSGTLPSGLTLNADTGVLSGTPDVAGAYSFTVQATDAIGTKGEQDYVVSMSPPNILISPPSPLPNADAGLAYSQQFSASGGIGPYTFSGVLLPPGLSLSSDGLFAGTPIAGNFSFFVTATDSKGTAATAPYNWSVMGLTVTPAAIPNLAYGAAYSQQLSATGGSGAITYSVQSGSLPDGLTLSSSGLLSGTATAPGSFSFTVRAVDAGGRSGQTDYTVQVAAAAIEITPASLPDAAYGVAYSQQLNATGGIGTITYSVQSGTVPAGLSVSSSGLVSGTPLTPGYASFVVRATDANGQTGDKNFPVVVAMPTFSFTPSSLPGAIYDTAYSQQVTATGGIGTLSYSLSSGSLPAGVTLASSGLLSGTPTVSGSFPLSIKVSDERHYTEVKAYTLEVAAPTFSFTPVSLPNANYGAAYNQQLNATGGSGAITYGVQSGSLPAGVTLSPSGLLSGTPTVSGSFSFTAEATDAHDQKGQKNYTLTVTAGTIALSPGSLPAVNYAALFNQQLSAIGGVQPYRYAITSGTLPTSVTLSESGLLAGPMVVPGSYPFTVTATDANGMTGVQTYTLTINAATVTITPASLPTASYNQEYSQPLGASGGIGPFAFTITSGTLPAGITLTSNSRLSGTPTEAGSYPLTITATDNFGQSGSQTYTLTVSGPTISVSAPPAPPAKVGASYAWQFSAGGGVGPYTFTVAAGALPGGLTLNGSSGLLSGTPNAAGSFSFTVRATDSHGFSGALASTLAVAQPAPVAVDDQAGTPANQAVTIPVTRNDSGPITSIAVATPPAHGSASVDGLNVVYTPAANYFGEDRFTYLATGPGGSSAPATVSLTVTPLAVPVARPQSLTVLAGQTVTLDAAAGASGGPFTGAAIVSAPASGSASVSGTRIAYAAPADGNGDVGIGYTLSNPFGTSEAVTATIHVNPLPQPVAAQSAATTTGEEVVVDLTSGASGGPFLGASLLSVTPAEAGSAVIREVDGGGAGKAGGRRLELHFTVARTFSGTAMILYTLSNAYATSAPARVTVTVQARRDVSRDAEVSALLAAQASSARRFASAQISNFTRRLESLHGDGWGQSGFDVSIVPSASGTPAMSDDAQTLREQQSRRQERERQRQRGTEAPRYRLGLAEDGKPTRTTAVDKTDGDAVDAASATADTLAGADGLPELPAPRGGTGAAKQRLSAWMGGSVDFGQHYVNGRQSGFQFSTSGISLGADYRLNDLASVGLGAGFGRDRSDVGSHGSTSSGQSAVAALYGTLRPARGVFVDGLIGYGTLNFDSSRYLTDVGGFATGSRSGSQLFGSVAAGVEYRRDGWLLSPYARLDVLSATLDEYTETAAGHNALTYYEQTLRSTTGTLGVRAEGKYASPVGTWMPRARVEFRRQFDGGDDARLTYADLAGAGPGYTVNTAVLGTGNWAAGLGVRLQLRNGLELSFDYTSNLDLSSGRSQGLMLGVSIPME